MNADLWLCLTIVIAGLWSGLLLTVTTILHPMFASEDDVGFRHDLGRFLPIARRSPTNYVLVIGLVVAPAIALAAMRDEVSGAPFVLTAIGLVFTFIGAMVISRFAAEPNYDVILSDETPAGSQRWTTARRRYFTLNWVRGAFVWTALGCFSAAGYMSWT